MKSRIFIFVIASLSIARAQPNSDLQKIAPKKFIDKVAIIGGLSLVSVWGNDEYKMYGKTKTGYTLGIELIHSIRDRFELVSMLLLEGKGQKTVFPLYLPSYGQTVVGEGSIDINSNYITFSVLPKYLMGKKRNVSIGVGGYFSNLQSAGSIFDYNYINNYSPNFYQAANITKYSKAFDFGLSFALGYTFAISKRVGIYTQLINNLGLTQTTLTLGSSPSAPLGKNNVSTFLIGIKFKRN